MSAYLLKKLLFEVITFKEKRHVNFKRRANERFYNNLELNLVESFTKNKRDI